MMDSAMGFVMSHLCSTEAAQLRVPDVTLLLLPRRVHSAGAGPRQRCVRGVRRHEQRMLRQHRLLVQRLRQNRQERRWITILHTAAIFDSRPGGERLQVLVTCGLGPGITSAHGARR